MIEVYPSVHMVAVVTGGGGALGDLGGDDGGVTGVVWVKVGVSWGVGESTWDVAVAGVLSVHRVVVVHRLLLLPGRRHGVPETDQEITTMKRRVPPKTPKMFIFCCYYCLFMVRFIMS